MRYRNIIIPLLLVLFFNFTIEAGTVEVLSDDSKYLNLEYYSLFQIPSSIMTLFSSGGERSGHELSKAFDNNWNTQWFSEGGQGEEYTNPTTNVTYDSLTNNIIITFSSTVVIDKMVFKTDNCYTCEGIGYPTELKIYSKLKSSSEEELNPYEESGFTLIDDIVSDATQSIVLFTFNQSIKCDQMKLEWADIKTYYPRFDKITTARQIMLFFPETAYFNETILNLFSKDDYTQMTLSDEFNNLEIIEEIIANSQDIINFNEEINTILQRAKLAASGGLKFDEKREFSTNQSATRNIIRQRGNIASFARNILKMASAGTNRQSMGIYGLPGEKITFYVTGDSSDPLPSIRFTQYIGHYSNWLGTEFTLVQGRQTYSFDNFTVSTYSITAKAGGPLYISNPYTSDQQSQNVKVYIEGGTLFPAYRLGESEEEYKEFLAEYVTMYENNPDTYLDITELFGYRSMITVQATLAYNIYKDESKGPLTNLNTWDEYIKKLFIYDGVQYEPTDPYYDVRNTYVNLHIRYAQPFGAAYAAYEHIGIFSDGWFNGAIYGGTFGWGFAHEIGHTMDINERTVSENSNNMISKYDDAYLRRDGTRGEFSKSLNYLTLDDVDVYERGCTSDTCLGFFNNMYLNFLVWWYLESYYPGYWGSLDNMYRYNYSLSTGMTRTERLIFFSNVVTGVDLGYYFYRWGFYMNNEGIFVPENAGSAYQEAMENYIKEGKIDNSTKLKYWYIDYKEYLYIVEGGEGCYSNKNAYDVQIKNVFYINTTRTILLLPEISCEGHLGFEIYEHDKLIGFTYGTSFVDTNTYSSDYAHEYKIVAIDRKLIASKESDVRVREVDAQVCSFNSVIYNSIKEAVEYAESLDTDEEINIYLLKDSYESTITINKAVNIYLATDVENIKIFRIDDGPLFNINSGGILKIEGESSVNKIYLDGLSLSHKGSLVLSYKGTFTGNYLTLQNNINSENYGGAIWAKSSTITLSNSLIYNNQAAYGGGYNGQMVSGSNVGTFTNVVFDSNIGTYGASIRNTGKVVLNDCTIKNSYSSNYGGGLSNEGGGECYISGGKIYNNEADNIGGGLYLDGYSTLTNVEISNNKANYGAGIGFSGGNNRRIVTIGTGTTIFNNDANIYGGGLYMAKGVLNINDASIYNNKINGLDGLTATNHSDIFLIENGLMYINGAKLSGSIFKADSATIYLKSSLVKYSDDSNIYIDFINDGNDKTIFTGSNYAIISDDIDNINLIDSNLGTFSLSSESSGNTMVFSPQEITVSFCMSVPENEPAYLSLLEEKEEKEVKYYYGKEIILSKDFFPVKENEYVKRLFDEKGKEYKVGQSLKLLENIRFLYDKGFKNKIILDVIDYQEDKLIVPNEPIYLPTFRSDHSTDKLILRWKDIENGEIFKKNQKIIADKNRTLVAEYSGDYFPVRILLFNNKQLSKTIKYGQDIVFPVEDIPEDIHFIGWKDELSNKIFDNDTKSIPVKKEYLLKGMYIIYVNYYINNELKVQKIYDFNSLFSLLNNSEISTEKILGWKDKDNNEYYADKQYKLQHDINLYAIVDETSKSGNWKTTIIIIASIVLLCIFALLTFRYIRRKNIVNVIEDVPKTKEIEANAPKTEEIDSNDINAINKV